MTERTCSIDGCGKAHRARGLCVSHYNKRHMTSEQRHPMVRKACSICGTEVLRRLHSDRRPTCSVACRTALEFGKAAAPVSGYQWQHDAKQRARANGCTIIEDFDRLEIFERDDWTCYLCSQRCDEPDPYNVRSATIDHVVAYVNGGQHTRDNARTACLGCNSAKAHRDVAAA